MVIFQYKPSLALLLIQPTTDRPLGPPLNPFRVIRLAMIKSMIVSFQVTAMHLMSLQEAAARSRELGDVCTLKQVPTIQQDTQNDHLVRLV